MGAQALERPAAGLFVTHAHISIAIRRFSSTCIERRWETLSELNQFLVSDIAREHLGITTRFADSRDYRIEGSKFDRLSKSAHELEADVYVSGPSARDYLEQDGFGQMGIELIYKSYEGYPEYRQRFPPFEHAVSILDLLSNVGPDAARYIWGWRENRIVKAFSGLSSISLDDLYCSRSMAN